MARSPLAPAGTRSPRSRLRDLAARWMPVAIWAADALTKIGSAWLARPVPGYPLTSRGLDLSSKIRVPVPAVPFGSWQATRRAASAEMAGRAGVGGRGLG